MANQPKINVEVNGYDYYRTQLTIGRDSKGNFIQKQFYGNSKTDAENKKLEYIRSLDAGLNPDLAAQSLTMAMHTWLWTIEKNSGNKSSSFERYEGIYRNYIEDSDLGYLIVSTIKKLAIQQHFNKLKREGKTYSQIKNLHKLLNKFFKYAEQDGYIIKNPCIGIKLIKEDEEILDDEDETIEVFTKDELKRIVNSLKHEKIRYIVMFALFTGARQGEILALKKKDIKDYKVVKINKTVRTVKVFDDDENFHYEKKVTRPKTKYSNRENPIPDVLVPEIKKLEKLNAEEKLKIGSRYIDNGLLFPTSTGTYIDASNLLKIWKKVLEKAKVPYKKFHALRHTFATTLIEQGTPIVTVSRLLGHSNVNTTEIYTHIQIDLKEKEVNCLNEMLL